MENPLEGVVFRLIGQILSLLQPQHKTQDPGVFAYISLHAWKRTFRTSQRTDDNFSAGRSLIHSDMGHVLPSALNINS